MTLVRSVVDSDESDLYALVSAFPTPTPPTRREFRSVFHERLADSSSCVYVLESSGALVGYIAGYMHTAFYAGGATAWVDEILVDDALRRQGLGRALMDRFEAWAQANGCRLIGLATAGAREFYLSLGFDSKAAYFKKYLPVNG